MLLSLSSMTVCVVCVTCVDADIITACDAKYITPFITRCAGMIHSPTIRSGFSRVMTCWMGLRK